MNFFTELVDFLNEIALAIVLMAILVGTFILGFQLSPQGYKPIVNDSVLGLTTEDSFVIDTTAADLNSKRLTQNSVSVYLTDRNYESFVSSLKNNTNQPLTIFIQPTISEVDRSFGDYHLKVDGEEFKIWDNQDYEDIRDAEIVLPANSESQLYLILELNDASPIQTDILSEVILELGMR